MTKKNSKKHLVIELLLLAVIAALVAVMVLGLGPKGRVTVHYLIPDGESTQTVWAGKSFVPENAGEIDGYRFIGWKDVNGNFAPEEMKIYEDTWLSAVYSLKLETEKHIAYLDADNGIFRPADGLTFREGAIALYRLLDTTDAGKGEFSDVSRDDSCYAAAATLKDLGVLAGNRLHPDDEMSFSDFYSLLSGFFPAKELENIPKNDETVTREDAAVIINGLLGRTGDENKDYGKVGTFIDVPKSNEHFWAIAESCIEHEYSGSDNWTSSKAMPELEEGPVLCGYDLHYLDKDLNGVVSASVGNLMFDENGVWTTGMPELDTEIRDILKNNVDPSSQTREEMLKILYDYVVNNFSYRGGTHYDGNQSGWAYNEAYETLKHNAGNCFGFAAVFTVLARSIGYDALECAGSDHGWTEIVLDGEKGVFDPELEWFYLGEYGSTSSMFDRKDVVGQYEGYKLY